MKRINHPVNTLSFLLVMFGVFLMSPMSSFAAEYSLSFAVSGVVADIAVKPGVQVKKGAVLAVLDQRPLMVLKTASEFKVKAATVKYQVLARRSEQAQQLFDSLSASAENVEDAKTATVTARSELETAKADALIIAWKYERSTLRAPFSGTVIHVPGYLGMVIPRNGDVVPIVVIKTP